MSLNWESDKPVTKWLLWDMIIWVILAGIGWGSLFALVRLFW